MEEKTFFGQKFQEGADLIIQNYTHTQWSSPNSKMQIS